MALEIKLQDGNLLKRSLILRKLFVATIAHMPLIMEATYFLGEKAILVMEIEPQILFPEK